MPMQRAVVWDLDGVMVDSAQAHNVSWTTMANEFGVPYDPDRDFRGIFGRHNTDIISSLWNVSDPEHLERMALRKEELFREAARTLRPLPGVVDLVHALDEAGWKQAIGSSAPLANVSLLLSVTGLDSYMQAIASGEDVEEGKPNPQVFLVAFDRLAVAPQDGVVIEDAPAGVKAALAAGAACLAVTTTQTEQVLRDAGAHLVLPTLDGVTIQDLENLIQSAQPKQAE